MNYTYTIISYTYFRMNKYILAKDDKYNKYFCNFFYVYINLQKFLIIKAIKNKKKKRKFTVLYIKSIGQIKRISGSEMQSLQFFDSVSDGGTR